MSIEQNKQIVREFLVGSGTTWLDLAHPDLSFFVAGDMEGCGHLDMQGLADLYTMLSRDATAPLKVEPVHMIAEGDFVAVEAVGHMPLSDGRTYNNHYHIVFEIKDGKIKTAREYSDTDHLRRTFDLKGSPVKAKA
jgi:uncharacterized protein